MPPPAKGCRLPHPQLVEALLKIDWLAALRDVVIVALLGALGTRAITSLVGGTTALTQLLVAFVLLTVGFTISGCLKGPGRFKHLAVVGGGVWLLRIVDALVREPERLPAFLVIGTVSMDRV